MHTADSTTESGCTTENMAKALSAGRVRHQPELFLAETSDQQLCEMTAFGCLLLSDAPRGDKEQGFYTYTGGFSRGLRSGWGKLEYPTGEIYVRVHLDRPRATASVSCAARIETRKSRFSVEGRVLREAGVVILVAARQLRVCMHASACVLFQVRQTLPCMALTDCV
eukprot:3937872-Rhodomonas_salina.3